jgi:diacylglycerol kinase (ATP)
VSLESLGAKRAAIIYNPVARALARRQHLLQRTIELMARQGIRAELICTTAPGTASIQARRQIEAGCDLIVAAGGDGTINEVANGMFDSNVPLAILPGGTANVLARETRMPIDFLKVASQLSTFRPVRIAAGVLHLGNLGQRSFLCMAGAGLDAGIVHDLNLDLKAALGKMAYYVGGFSQAFRSLPQFEVTVDGQQYEASFALISRVRNYGGDLEIARGASLLRNTFEVVLFRGTQALQYVPYLLGVALKQTHRMQGCTTLRGRSVTCRQVAGQDIFVQVDGELAGKLPVTAELLPNALTLLVPSDFLVREQSLIEVPACA